MLFGIAVSSHPQLRVWSQILTVPGSCQGRGPRAAGWFADYLGERQDGELTSLVLEGGIKGWATAGAEYTALMDEYDASVWA